MKIKKNNDLIITIVSPLIGLLAGWYILDSLLLGIVYAFAVLIGTMLILRKYKKKEKMFHNIDASYNFVNLMNVAMLSTNSVYEAYKSIENYVDVDFANIANEDLHLQLQEISDSYNINSFKMYVNTLLIYDNEGGNYKQMQEIPSSLCQNTKVYYHKLDSKKFHKLIEITTLFSLWICVLAFLKISIPDYYALMMQNSIYQFVILFILLIGSFFFYLTFMEYLNNNIRGM
jgi:hypothetical protein